MFKKIFRFIWKDDSLLSWIVNVILAFLIVKFLIFPGLGLIFNTQLPVVAVISCSMEHNVPGSDPCSLKHVNLDDFWKYKGKWYEDNGITKIEFENYPMKDGFNKGDIIFLYGSEKIRKGDIIVFKGSSSSGNPIIHRVVKIKENGYQTKGDNNQDSYPQLNEININPQNTVGKAFLRIPYLGWVKIGFSNLIDMFRR